MGYIGPRYQKGQEVIAHAVAGPVFAPLFTVEQLGRPYDCPVEFTVSDQFFLLSFIPEIEEKHEGNQEQGRRSLHRQYTPLVYAEVGLLFESTVQAYRNPCWNQSSSGMSLGRSLERISGEKRASSS